MTPKEQIDIYRAAYKEAEDIRLKPAPNPQFIQSPIKVLNGESAGQNNSLTDKTDISKEKTPTWTAPVAKNLFGNNYLNRRETQNATMDDMNRYITHKVSPTVNDSYSKDGRPFNMSREAMLRRINMLKRQQGIDERLRKVEALPKTVNDMEDERRWGAMKENF